MMRRLPEYYHPLTWLCYFAAVIASAMLFVHPLFLLAEALCAGAACVILCGGRAFLKTLLFAVPALAVIAVFNPLVNHGGRTVLFRLFGGAFTLEALIYGFCSGGMLTLVFVWFSVYGRVVTGDRFLYLFGRLFPSTALLVVMTQRLIPLFMRRAQAISSAQRTLLCDISRGGLKSRFQGGLRIASALMSWSLEEGLDTADSMRARGYGVAKRSSFSIYRFTPADGLAIALIASLFISCLYLYFTGVSYRFYPLLYFPPPGPVAALALLTYAACALTPFCLLPAAAAGRLLRAGRHKDRRQPCR